MVGSGAQGFVAPLAGAWIEINRKNETKYEVNVAPLAGAWIEIVWMCRKTLMLLRRSPRGSVD